MTPPAAIAHRLHYFPLRSRAELIRLVYAYGGLPLEEVTLPLSREFLALKPTLPFQQLPMMDIEGRRYTQSLALARHAAKRVGLYPLEDHLAALEVDMVVETVGDIQNPIILGTFLERDAERRAKNIARLNKYTLPAILGGLDRRLQERPVPKAPFFLGHDLSLADLAVFDVITNVLKPEKSNFPIDFAESYPRLTELVKHVQEEPRIAAYVANPINTRPHRPTF